jgi:hypothetical protein
MGYSAPAGGARAAVEVEHLPGKLTGIPDDAV